MNKDCGSLKICSHPRQGQGVVELINQLSDLILRSNNKDEMFNLLMQVRRYQIGLESEVQHLRAMSLTGENHETNEKRN